MDAVSPQAEPLFTRFDDIIEIFQALRLAGFAGVFARRLPGTML